MKTWRKYRTYKRVQSLWQEYQEIARQEMGKENGQLALVSQKLSVFLDSFQIAYRDFKESGRGAGLSLESLFGDCTEMLVALLELVDKHAQPGPVDAPASIATNLVCGPPLLSPMPFERYLALSQ
ncbi:hypothetical protein T484DRAFT_2146896 [Baffinella frigidus]|nr:hypothetical protein T484DRAFT_2146896 [Cryptophyta sp. CCMP2293]